MNLLLNLFYFNLFKRHFEILFLVLVLNQTFFLYGPTTKNRTKCMISTHHTISFRPNVHRHFTNFQMKMSLTQSIRYELTCDCCNTRKIKKTYLFINFGYLNHKHFFFLFYLARGRFAQSKEEDMRVRAYKSFFMSRASPRGFASHRNE